MGPRPPKNERRTLLVEAHGPEKDLGRRNNRGTSVLDSGQDSGKLLDIGIRSIGEDVEEGLSAGLRLGRIVKLLQGSTISEKSSVPVEGT